MQKQTSRKPVRGRLVARGPPRHFKRRALLLRGESHSRRAIALKARACCLYELRLQASPQASERKSTDVQHRNIALGSMGN